MINNRYFRLLTHPVFVILMICVTAITAFLTYKIFGTIENIKYRGYLEQLSNDKDISQQSFIDLSTQQATLQYSLITSSYNNNPDQDALSASLQKNSVSIAKYIGTIYGEEKQTEILKILDQYNLAIKNYAQAARTNDNELTGSSLVELTGFPSKLANFFVSVNPAVSKDLLTLVISDYTAIIKTTIDSYDVQDYAGSLTQRQKAVEQLNNIFKAIAKTMSTQFPEKFEDQTKNN